MTNKEFTKFINGLYLKHTCKYMTFYRYNDKRKDVRRIVFKSRDKRIWPLILQEVHQVDPSWELYEGRTMFHNTPTYGIKKYIPL